MQSNTGLQKQLEVAQEEIDLRTAAYLRSEGETPLRRRLDELDDLLAEVSEARGEVDRMILENST